VETFFENFLNWRRKVFSGKLFATEENSIAWKAISNRWILFKEVLDYFFSFSRSEMKLKLIGRLPKPSWHYLQIPGFERTDNTIWVHFQIRQHIKSSVMFLRNNFFSNFQLKIDKRTRQLCFIEIGETLEIVLCRYEHTYAYMCSWSKIRRGEIFRSLLHKDFAQLRH
jgi:hypothetical protein